jgi:hypothetical protein
MVSSKGDWSANGHGTDSRIVGTAAECAIDLELDLAEVMRLTAGAKPWGFNSDHEVVYSLDDLRVLLGCPRIWKRKRKKSKRKATYVEYIEESE